MALSRRITQHRSFNPRGKKALGRLGEKTASAILEHPKVTRENVRWVTGAVKVHGLEAMRPLLDHPKTTAENADSVSRMASTYGINAVKPLLDHPKTTAENFRELALTMEEEGMSPTLDAWGHPKVNAESIRDTAALMKVHGAAARPLLDHPGTIPENLGAIAHAAMSQGMQPTLDVLNLRHQKVTKDNIKNVTELVRQRGIQAVKPLLDHPKTTAENLGEVIRVANRRGIHSVLSVWDHPRITARELDNVARWTERYSPEEVFKAWDHPNTNGRNFTDVAQLARAYGTGLAMAAMSIPRTMGEEDHMMLVRYEAEEFARQAKALKGEIPEERVFAYQRELASRGREPTIERIRELHRERSKP